MKKLTVLIFALSFNISAFSQIAWDEEKQSARIESVIEVADVSKAVLYERAKLWMARNLKSSDNQILYDEDGQERIIGTGNLLLSNAGSSTDRVLNFKISIFIRDGKFKVIGDNMIFSDVLNSINSSRTPRTFSLDQVYQQMSNSKKQKRKSYMDDIDAAFAELLKSLVKDLNVGSTDESEDW